MSGGARRRRVAVVLFNLGGPDSLKTVRPFLFNLFRDPAIITLPAVLRLPLAALIAFTRNREAAANYAHMGGASPLLQETEVQAEALARELGPRLGDCELKVVVAMRYWAPLIGDVAREVEAFAPDEIVLTPLYPQFSTTTTGSSLDAWRRSYRGPGRVRSLCCYFDQPDFVAAHVDRIEATHAAAGRPANLKLLFSAHGLPERVIAGGDPYRFQVERSCAAVAQALGSAWDWDICYQSRVGPLKWIGPATPDAIARAGREGKGVLVVPITFVSEHVETLVELDRDYAEVARAAGCPTYLRAPAIGAAPAFIAGLAAMVQRSLADGDGEVRPGVSACGTCWAKCPNQAEGRAA